MIYHKTNNSVEFKSIDDIINFYHQTHQIKDSEEKGTNKKDLRKVSLRTK